MSNCFRRISRRERVAEVAGANAVLPDNPRVKGIDLQVYSTLPQVVEFGGNCRFDVVSVKNGAICFFCDRIEICEAGTYLIEFMSENEENIPLALTLNGDAVQSVVYKASVPVSCCQTLLDLRRGDCLALTNKFSPSTLVMQESVINTVRTANAALSVVMV